MWHGYGKASRKGVEEIRPGKASRDNVTPRRRSLTSFLDDVAPRRYVVPVSDYTLPRSAVEAQLLLTQGVSRPGQIFVMERVSLHDGPETPLEMLNRESGFFAFRPDDEGGVLLVAKAHTVSLTVERQTPITDPVRLSAARMVGLECVLAGGSTIGGWASFELPLAGQRLLDYLNASREPFFAVWTHASTHFVNRAHVLYARPLE